MLDKVLNTSLRSEFICKIKIKDFWTLMNPTLMIRPDGFHACFLQFSYYIYICIMLVFLSMLILQIKTSSSSSSSSSSSTWPVWCNCWSQPSALTYSYEHYFYECWRILLLMHLWLDNNIILNGKGGNVITIILRTTDEYCPDCKNCTPPSNTTLGFVSSE